MKKLLSFPKTVWNNRQNRTNLPRFLTYIVTFTCNARCIMCDSWKKPSPDDLTIEEIEGIFKQLPDMDMVRLTGGEPFVRRDMLHIAHLAQKELKPLMLHVTTNGFLTERIVEFCEKRDKKTPLSMLVSVDGLEAKHNYVRGKDDAWSKVLATLEALAPRQKELRLSLSANQTIVDADGAEQYRKLHDFLAPMGVRNNFVMAYDVSATYSLEEETEVAPTQIGEFATFGEFKIEQIEKLLDEVEKDLKNYPALDRAAKSYYVQGIRNRLFKKNGFPNPKCVALNSHIRLMPNGKIPTCQFNTRTIGDLREKTFKEIWFDEKAEAQRNWVRRCPGCWAECETLPNAVYTGDILRAVKKL